MAEPTSEQSIFLHAIGLPSPADRAAFLDEVCRANPRLRIELEALLAAHDRLGGPLPPTGLDQAGFEAAGPEAPPAFPQSPEVVGAVLAGRYKLLEPIGEGGMGTVWMARQTEPVKRLVAVKLIKAGMDGKQVLARFEAERQALALMDHPNIAKVHDAGATPGGRPFFVMELVKGVPITKYCDQYRLTPRQRLELFVPVCQAIQHAHQKGIIHRDIKPSNVLVALYDDKPVVKVIDFGVAKAAGQQLTERSLHTGFGAVIGTVEYMSPEQAGFNQFDVDTRSDIYSLGVLLYELLTGGPPFSRRELERAGMLEMLRVIREQEPSKPSTKLSSSEALPTLSANRGTEPKRLTRLVRGELDWIVMKSLEKDRSRRYETANGFAMDVQRYLADEPVQACPPSAGYRLRKFVRRNKGPVLAASLVTLTLIGGVIGTTWGMFRATDAEAAAKREAGEKTVALGEKETALGTAKAKEIEAQKQATIAREQELLARRRFCAAQMNLAQQAWEAGHKARVMELLESQRPRFDQEDLRSFEWYYLWQLCHRGQRLGWRVERNSSYSVALSPDGKLLASAAIGYDANVKVWSTTDGQERLVLRGHRLGAWCVAFSPDGKVLASGGQNGDLKLWDLASGQELATIVCTREPYGVKHVAFSPDGKTLATSCGDNNTLQLWDIATRKLRGTVKGHTGGVITVAFSPDGKMLATGSGTGDLSVKLWSWDGTNAKERVTIPAVGWGRPVLFSPDSKTLAIGRTTVDLYDVATGNKRASLEGHRSEISSLAFSPDGKTLASGSGDRTVRLWDLASGKERNQLVYHSPVHSVSFSADGKVLVAGSVDGTVKLWELDAAEAPDTLKHGGPVRSVLFSRDGQTLIAAGDHPTKLWDVATGQEKATLQGHSRSGALSEDGSTLAALDPDKTIQVWDLATGQAKAKFQQEKDAKALALSPDGTILVTFGPWDNPTFKLWNTGSGQLRKACTVAPDLSVLSVAFSPDGNLVATGAQFDSVCVWNTATGQQQFALQQGETGLSGILSLRFSPDGKGLAVGTDRGTVRLWDVATQQLLISLKGHTQGVNSIAFSRDGKTLATASADQTVKLWDSATGQERMTLKAGPVTCVAFAPDGKTLATASTDGTVKLWRGATDQEATAWRDELDPDDPDSPVAVNALGDRLWELGKPGEAAEAYRKALARAEKLAAAFPTIAEYRLEWAFSQFAAAVSLSPDGVPIPEQAHRQFSEICQKLPAEQQRTLARRYASLAWQLATGSDSVVRHPRGAVELANKAVKLGPKETAAGGTVWEVLGVACYRAGDWKGAVEALTRAMDELETFRSWFVMSMACWKLGAREEARKWYIAALAGTEKQYPTSEELLRFRGEAAALLGLSEKAADLAPQALTDDVQLYSLILDANPRAAWAYRNRGTIQLNRRNFDKAILDFDKVIDLKPLDAQAWYLRGLAQYRLWKHAEAIADFSKCLELKGDHFDALHLRGHSHKALGRWKESIADHTRAIELAPGPLELHLCRANAYIQLEEWQKAAADFEHATTLSPLDPTAWYNLALLKLQRDDRASYGKVCSSMLDRFERSTNAETAYWIVWTCVLAPDALADWKKPLQFAEQAHANSPKNYDAINNLGAALYRAGRFKEAAQRLTEAEAAFQQSPTKRSSIVYNWLFQAMAQHRLGNTEEAASWLKKAVQEIDEPKTAQDPATIPWNRRLTLQLLRREAEELLTTKSH